MSLPRQVLPNQFYLVTRRCTQRQFLLRPDAETNNAFTYCLIEAAQRCQIDVLLLCAMSNHYHAVIFDRWGRYPEFGLSWRFNRRVTGTNWMPAQHSLSNAISADELCSP